MTQNDNSNKNQQEGRDKAGRFLPGNKFSKGRPPDKIRVDEKLWLEALSKVEGRRKKSFMEHIWEQAYSSNTVLVKVLDKLFADKSIHLSKLGGAGNINIIISRFNEHSAQDVKPITDITIEEDKDNG